MRSTSSISRNLRKTENTHSQNPVAHMLIRLFPVSSLLSSGIPSISPLVLFHPPCLPPSPADLHWAALINTPLFLASRLLNVKTGNQRVTFHIEWKSKVPGCFQACAARGPARYSAHESSGKSSPQHSSVAWKDTRVRHLLPTDLHQPSVLLETFDCCYC